MQVASGRLRRKKAGTNCDEPCNTESYRRRQPEHRSGVPRNLGDPIKAKRIIGDAFNIFTGGKGFNQATAAARLECRSYALVGSVGADPFGEMLLAAAENEHINSRFVTRRTDIGTGIATIVIEPDGDNSIIVVPRANMALTTADIDAAADCIADADVLLLQLETPITTSEHAAAIAKKHSSNGRPKSSTRTTTAG